MGITGCDKAHSAVDAEAAAQTVPLTFAPILGEYCANTLLVYAASHPSSNLPRLSPPACPPATCTADSAASWKVTYC